MEVLPINVVELLSVFMGISIILVPVIGLTARFALKPTVEALSKVFEQKGLGETVHILERRMALMEQQIESIESAVSRIADATEFDRALGAGRGEARDRALGPAGGETGERAPGGGA